MRVLRFIAACRIARRHRIRLDRHNLRALWLQSKPGWHLEAPLDLTEEEIDAFMEALDSLHHDRASAGPACPTWEE